MVAAMGILMAACGIGAASGQLCEQYLGLPQVGSVKALGKPAVDLRQQLAGLSAFAVLLPEASQAYGRPQLQGLGLLPAGNSKRLVKTRLRFARELLSCPRCPVPQALPPQQQLPLAADTAPLRQCAYQFCP